MSPLAKAIDRFNFSNLKFPTITSRFIVAVVLLLLDILAPFGRDRFLVDCRIATRSKITSSRNVDQFVDTFLENDSQNIRKFKKILNQILVPRSVNSTGHRQVRKFIKSSINDLGSNWYVDEDSFIDTTPIGEVKFRNIIATYTPKDWLCSGNESVVPKRIVLACHYDTLHPSMISSIKQPNPFFAHFGNNLSEFTGAIDAAVSCSMLIYLAQFMTPYLDKVWSIQSNNGRKSKRHTPYTLQLIFFDGEEALVSNSQINSNMRKLVSVKSNSLYGSRHLARKWSHNTPISSSAVNDTSSINLAANKMRNKRQLTSLHRYKKRLGRLLSHCSKSDRLNTLTKYVDGVSPNEILLPAKDNSFKKKKNKKSKHNKKIKHHKGAASHGIAWTTTTGSNQTNLSELSQMMQSLQSTYYSLDNIDLFLLLDLIGGSSPRFFNTNLGTVNHFRLLALIERNVMKSLNINGQTTKPYFQVKPSFLLSLVRDDHLPFVVHNVSVLHLIPHPFPRIWHRMEDNFDNLNFDTIRRLIIILELFLLNAFNAS